MGRGPPSGWGYVKSDCNPEKGGRECICPGSIFLAQYNCPVNPFFSRGGVKCSKALQGDLSCKHRALWTVLILVFR